MKFAPTPRSTAAERPPPGYRPGVGVMLFNTDGLVFVAQRLDMPSAAWQMPQGGMDAGETPRQAAMREMREEVGTDRAEIIAEMPAWLSYDLPSDLVAKLWGGRYRGQTQKWFAARFLGSDADIDIATPDPEFSAWKWAPLDELPMLIVPFKRPLYETIVRELGPVVRAATRPSA